MPKRKHSDLDTKSPVANDATSRIANRLSVKFDYEVNVLSRALKVSRGFEKQKMGRRGKKARSEEGAKPGTVGRIEEENKILKALDMDKTASKYILKQLSRTKRIAEAPAFVYFRENLKKNISLDGPQSAAEGNVLARLYKSNPVKEVFPGIMEGFRKLLGLDAPAGKQEKQEKGGSSESAPRGKSEGKEGKQAKSKAKDEDAAEERDVDVNMDKETVSGSDDDDFSQFNSRLAGSDSESDDDNDRLDPMAISPSPSRSPSPDLDLDLEPSPSASSSPEPESSPVKKLKSTTTATKQPLTSTTFLPSLSMGGYVSGSESEPSDDEDSQPRRKNRMGQQARRALWEKKFGSRANHVKTQVAKEKRNRDSGWDVRRGATGGGKGAATGANREMRGNRLQREGENKRNEPVDDKPMHPSWEAARKAKEAQASTAAFKGKKVTFD